MSDSESAVAEGPRGQPRLGDALSFSLQPAIKNHGAGALAGVSRALVGQPFDTVKVKMQTHSDLYRGSFDCLKAVLNTEGVRGLYRGVGAPLAGNVVTSSVQFSVYNEMRHYQDAWVSGAVAGAVSSLVTSPVEFIRIKMQLASKLEHGKQYRSIIHCGMDIVSKAGNNPLALFRGLGITIARESIGYAAFFSMYHHVGSITGVKVVDDISRGVLCGVALWGSMYPIDVVKSRIQGASLEVEHHGSLWHARDIYRSLGWRGFLKGFDITMIRALPVNVAIVMTVETFHTLIK